LVNLTVVAIVNTLLFIVLVVAIMIQTVSRVLVVVVVWVGVVPSQEELPLIKFRVMFV
jgi:hypothetical protein